MQDLRRIISHDQDPPHNRVRAAAILRRIVYMLRSLTVAALEPTESRGTTADGLVLLLVRIAGSANLPQVGHVGAVANLAASRKILQSGADAQLGSSGNGFNHLIILLAASLQLLTQHRDLLAAAWAHAAGALLDQPMHTEFVLRRSAHGGEPQILPGILDSTLYLDRACPAKLALLVRVLKALASDTPVGLRVRCLCKQIFIELSETSHQSGFFCDG